MAKGSYDYVWCYDFYWYLFTDIWKMTVSIVWNGMQPYSEMFVSDEQTRRWWRGFQQNITFKVVWEARFYNDII